MGSVVVEAGVNPEVSRRCYHLVLSCRNRSNVRCGPLVPQEKFYGFLTGWHSGIAKPLAPASLAKQIEANIGWLGLKGNKS